jgi:hypothetical protein
LRAKLRAACWPRAAAVSLISVCGGRMARKRQRGAPVPHSWPDSLDGAWAAGHSTELAFGFNNAALGIQSSGGGEEVDPHQPGVDQLREDWQPEPSRLAERPRFTAQNPATMIFQARSELKVRHDAELVTLLTQGPVR